MAKTVIALMDSAREAENVVRDLAAGCGCERGDIGLMAPGAQAQDDQAFFAGAGLTDLGVPDEDARCYAEGVKRGGTLVVLQARTEETAACAADVMRRHGAVDIEQRAAQWRREGWDSKRLEVAQLHDFTVDIKETAEQPVVVKRARVVEEVRISKQVTRHEHTVRDTVRKTDVHVERYDGAERRRNTGGYTGVERRAVNRT